MGSTFRHTCLRTTGIPGRYPSLDYDTKRRGSGQIACHAVVARRQFALRNLRLDRTKKRDRYLAAPIPLIKQCDDVPYRIRLHFPMTPNFLKKICFAAFAAYKVVQAPLPLGIKWGWGFAGCALKSFIHKPRRPPRGASSRSTSRFAERRLSSLAN